MNAAQADFTRTDTELAKAKEGFEVPPIDASLAVVEPEAATAVASAAPVSTETAPPVGFVDLTSNKPAPDGLDVQGKLFGSDPITPPEPARPAPAGSPAVISARPTESLPKRRLRIESNAVAFPVGPDLAVTSADAVSNASYITLQIPGADTMNAEVVSSDQASGLALLRVSGKRMPYLPLADAFTAGPVTCISFPEVNLFDPVAGAITGNIAAVTASPGKFIVNLSRSPRLGGGPLLVSGKVVGVQLANRDSDLHAIAVATLEDVKKLLASEGPPAMAPVAYDPKSITMQLTAIKENR
jgi:S1-C subfamily serine protease